MAEELVCAVCGSAVLCDTFQKPENVNMIELDGRVYASGYDFKKEVSMCPFCRYVAKDLSSLKDGQIEEVVNSPKYKNLSLDETYNADAKKFILYGQIYTELKEFKEASNAYLKAAWVYDDLDDDEHAVKLREKSFAAALLHLRPNLIKGIFDRNDIITTLDVLRRTARFDSCINLLNYIKELKNHDGTLAMLIDFEETLCKNRDASKHNYFEALGKEILKIDNFADIINGITFLYKQLIENKALDKVDLINSNMIFDKLNNLSVYTIEKGISVVIDNKSSKSNIGEIKDKLEKFIETKTKTVDNKVENKDFVQESIDNISLYDYTSDDISAHPVFNQKEDYLDSLKDELDSINTQIKNLVKKEGIKNISFDELEYEDENLSDNDIVSDDELEEDLPYYDKELINKIDEQNKKDNESQTLNNEIEDKPLEDIYEEKVSFKALDEDLKEKADLSNEVFENDEDEKYKKADDVNRENDFVVDKTIVYGDEESAASEESEVDEEIISKVEEDSEEIEENLGYTDETNTVEEIAFIEETKDDKNEDYEAEVVWEENSEVPKNEEPAEVYYEDNCYENDDFVEDETDFNEMETESERLGKLDEEGEQAIEDFAEDEEERLEKIDYENIPHVDSNLNEYDIEKMEALIKKEEDVNVDEQEDQAEDEEFLSLKENAIKLAKKQGRLNIADLQCEYYVGYVVAKDVITELENEGILMFDEKTYEYMYIDDVKQK